MDIRKIEPDEQTEYFIESEQEKYEAESGVTCNYTPFCFSAKIGDEIVGVIAGATYFSEIYIDELVVKEAYRNRGIGKRLYDEATILVEQYNRDLAAWERQVHGVPQPQQAPPEKESIRKKLRDMEAEAKRRYDARRQQTRPRSHDYDRGR